MANMITGIISLSVGAVLLSTVFMTTIKNTNTTYLCGIHGNETCSWAVSELAMWGLLGLIGTVGLVYGVLSVFGLA